MLHCKGLKGLHLRHRNPIRNARDRIGKSDICAQRAGAVEAERWEQMLDYLRWRKPREKDAEAVAGMASMGKVLGSCVPEGEYSVRG